MKLNNKILLLTPFILMLTLSSVNAMAADAPMICAVTEAVSCQKELDCESGSANDIDMPLFLKINPAKNEILSLKEDGERKVSSIRQTNKDKDGKFVIYQGVEPGGAWSTVINNKTGSMTISIASGESDAYIIYGACSISMLKP
jgi:hypothetical protein